MRVWWCACSRREDDFHSDDGLVGRVEDFVFVKEFEAREGCAMGSRESLILCLSKQVKRGSSWLTWGRMSAPPCLQPLRRPCSWLF